MVSGDGGGGGGDWYSPIVATRVVAVVVIDGCGLAAVAVYFPHMP